MTHRTLPCRRLPALLSLAVAASTAIAADPATQPALPGLHLKIPAGWQSRTHQPPAGGKPMPTVVQMSARESGGAFSVQITFLGNAPRKLSDDDIRKIAEGAAQQYVDSSVEQKTTLQELKSDNLFGYYATFTDAHPAPGGFPMVTSAVGRLGDGLMAVTIMHPKDSKNLPIALDMLRSATVGATPAGGAAAAPAAANTVRVQSPDKKWAVVFDLAGADPADTDVSTDGKASQLQTTAGNTICSAFIEPAMKPGNDAKVVRAYYWAKEKQAPLEYTAIKLLGDDKLALLEFITEGANPNVHGYLIHNGTWIDIHLSCPAGEAADTAAMEKAVKTARIEVAK
jgi:hypothetical protein